MSNSDKQLTLEDYLQTVVLHFDNEDRIVREAQLRKIRRLKLYWNSFSQIYWSDVARDYRIFGNDNLNTSQDNDQAYYDRPVNVFRAFLETVIAALSIQIPAPQCVPDDADNVNDISTAKAGNIIGELIYKHNDVLFLWLYALYVHMTEGMVAAHTYVEEDKKYGTYKENKYKREMQDLYVCPNCQRILPDDIFEQAEDIKLTEEDEFAPDEDDVDLHALYNEKEKPVCPDCAFALDPELQKSSVLIKRLVGCTNAPKGRVKIEIRGGAFVKIPVYARVQSEMPYLLESYETHYANALECYPDFIDQIPHGGWASTGVNDPYEWYARLNPQYRNAFPQEIVTIKNAWLRPAAFNILEEDAAKECKKKFPDGCCVTMVNDVVVDYYNEALDDCWTITRNPMFDYLTHEPLGELLVNIQDITNDLISLVLQTIEQGIPQNFVDPAILDLKAYQQVEAAPGTLTGTKPTGTGKTLKDGFHTLQTSSLSPEVFNFYNIIQQLGQFVSGALPSIYGGQMQSGSSRTASEYALSKSMALQRLSTTWRMFTIWWKDIMGKSIPAYMKLVHEDERIVKKDPYGNYVNVWVRKTDLQGKIGDIELENSEAMPVSDDQKADIVMKLMELNNQEVMMALTSPENLPFIRKIVKIPEFRLPGEDDRNKQYDEINKMIQVPPNVVPPDEMEVMVSYANGIEPPQPTEVSTIEIDPDIDNHQVEFDICRGWLISDAGRLCKEENPDGYRNVLLHAKEHMQVMQMQQMQQMQAELANQARTENINVNRSDNSSNNKQSNNSDNSEIKDASDARTPIE